MKSSLGVATLLCFTTWMSLAHANFKPGESCCVSWTKRRIPLDRIVNYAIQSEAACRIKAVRLRTVLAKTICAKPDADWTKKAIEKVDKERSQKGFASEMTPTGSTLATSPTSEKIPQKNVTLGEDTQEGGTRSSENVSQKSPPN
uniref:Chemokine interleukin-8-like domain-containing protein n=1 Tax=Oreochromis aureus TaxID=47969 RepID=A0AAZ1XFK7_OREAU